MVIYSFLNIYPCFLRIFCKFDHISNKKVETVERWHVVVRDLSQEQSDSISRTKHPLKVDKSVKTTQSLSHYCDDLANIQSFLPTWLERHSVKIISTLRLISRVHFVEFDTVLKITLDFRVRRNFVLRMGNTVDEKLCQLVRMSQFSKISTENCMKFCLAIMIR